MSKSSAKLKSEPAQDPKRPLTDRILRLAEYLCEKKISGARLFRVEAPLAGVDPLAWLAGQPGRTKFYWADRERRFETAAVGEADLIVAEGPSDDEASFSELEQRLSTSDGDIRYYGGMRFDNYQVAGRAWKAFGACRFFLPRFELSRRGAKGSLACNVLVSKDRKLSPAAVLTELNALNFRVPEEDGKIPRLRAREDRPDRATWGRNLDEALALLEKRALKKIVLARMSSLDFDGRLNPITLLQSLKEATTDCFHFCFALGPQTAFLGASPERLYARAGRLVETEALAGTRPRETDAATDRRLAQELLGSEKDSREHRLVVDGIREALAPLCEDVRVEEHARLLKLARSQHLLCAFRARLKDGVTDGELIGNLHPTPAVGGYPMKEALREIQRLESFDRGWYAGPFGWVARDRAEFAVAIRSGLVENSRLHLFAGAGIVKGSTAEGEWNEIENKISDFIKVLAGV